MILLELFNTKIKAEVEQDDGEGYQVTANIGDRDISFYSEIYSRDDKTVCYIEFMEVNKQGKNTYTLTKSGKEFEVFAFVKQCMEHIIKKHKPDFITFSSKSEEASRISLYKKMIRLAKGYKLSTKPINRDNKHSEIVFSLEKVA